MSSSKVLECLPQFTPGWHTLLSYNTFGHFSLSSTLSSILVLPPSLYFCFFWIRSTSFLYFYTFVLLSPPFYILHILNLIRIHRSRIPFRNFFFPSFTLTSLSSGGSSETSPGEVIRKFFWTRGNCETLYSRQNKSVQKRVFLRFLDLFSVTNDLIIYYSWHSW